MTQLSLSLPVPEWQTFDLPGADVRLRRDLFTLEECRDLLDGLKTRIEWRQDTFDSGRHEALKVLLPRLQAFYGDAQKTYVWAGITMVPHQWTPELRFIQRRVESAVGCSFNAVLLNRYRDGNDKVGWHADDEPSIRPRSTIASVSFGAERDFVMRRVDKALRVSIALPNGSLLTMSGTTQEQWQHAVPPRRGVTRERINLTFRQMA